MAVIFGHLIRCLYRSSGICKAKGCVKPEWIAEIFEVNLNNVYTARRFLITELRWLRLIKTSKPVIDKHGQWTLINLFWASDNAERSHTTSPRKITKSRGTSALSTSQSRGRSRSTPYIQNKNPLIKNPKGNPGGNGPTGLSVEKKNSSATRPCGSIGIGGRESFMKFCLSSSGCETRPAKGEPARAGS